MRLDEVTRFGVLEVACQCLGDRRRAVEETRHQAPLAVSADFDLHGVFGERVSGDAHGVARLGINHVHIRVMERVQRADEGTGGLAVGTEQAGMGVLNLVAFRPGFVGGDTVGEFAAGGGQIQVDGYPVPSRLQFNSLHLAAVGGQNQRVGIAAVIDEAVCEDDIAVGGQVKDSAGRSLPELEAYRLAVHLIHAIDRQEDFRFMSRFVEGHMIHTDALVLVESIDDVVGVGVIFSVVQFDLCANGHVKRILVLVDGLVGRYRLDGQFHAHRLG